MAHRPRKTVIAAVYPLACGAAHFNAAVKAMAETSETTLLSWNRMSFGRYSDLLDEALVGAAA